MPSRSIHGCHPFIGSRKQQCPPEARGPDVTRLSQGCSAPCLVIVWRLPECRVLTSELPQVHALNVALSRQGHLRGCTAVVLEPHGVASTVTHKAERRRLGVLVVVGRRTDLSRYPLDVDPGQNLRLVSSLGPVVAIGARLRTRRG